MSKQNNQNLPINLIAGGTKIHGDIVSDGDVRIDGNLQGKIVSKGRVVVGPTGHVSGKINCKSADISGRVEAEVKVSEILTLKASAKLIGDINVNKLAIEPGASFSGNCSMGGMVKDFSSNGVSSHKVKETA